MGYGIARGQKIKLSGIAGIEIHVFRKKDSRSNPDIDPDRTKDNFTLISPGWINNQSLSDCVRDRISQLAKKTKTGKTRKMKSDAVALYDFVITATHEDMEKMTKEQRADFFKSAAVHFANKFGGENVMYAVIHNDERTPHLHLGLVPEYKGTLCAKKLFTPKSLTELQDELHEKIFSRFGLDRGERGSEKKHLTTEELKSRTLAAANKKAASIVGAAGKEIEELEKKKKDLQSEVKALEIKGNERATLTALEKAAKERPIKEGVFNTGDTIGYKVSTAWVDEAMRLARIGTDAAETIAQKDSEISDAHFTNRELKDDLAATREKLDRTENDKWDVIKETAIYRESPAWIKRSLEKKSVEIRNFSDSLARIAPMLNKIFGEEKTIEIAGKALRRIGITDKQDARDFIRSNSLEASRQRMGKEPSGQKGIWSNPPGAINFLKASESDFAAVRPSLQMPEEEDWQGLTEAAKAERMADHRFDEDWSR